MNIEPLAESLLANGVKCMSIRPPAAGEQWIVNIRTNDTGWRCGAPADTLADAINNVMRAEIVIEHAQVTEDSWHNNTTYVTPDDDIGDLLG